MTTKQRQERAQKLRDREKEAERQERARRKAEQLNILIEKRKLELSQYKGRLDNLLRLWQTGSFSLEKLKIQSQFPAFDPAELALIYPLPNPAKFLPPALSKRGRKSPDQMAKHLQNLRIAGAAYQLTQDAHDEGVDCYAIEPTTGKRLVIQAKRHEGLIKAGYVRDLGFTCMDKKADGGILITTGHFGPQPKVISQKYPIELIDGKKLCELITQHFDLPTFISPRKTQKES